MVDFEVFLRRWTVHIVFIIVVLIVLYFVWKDQMKQTRTDGRFPSADGNGSLYYPGRGCQDDDVETLIARTYWAAYLNKRVVKWERVFVMSFFIVVIMLALVWKKVASVQKMLLTGIIVFFVVYMVENFLYIHGDLYNDANIRNNSKLLASKLGLNVDFVRTPKDPSCPAPDRVTIMGL